MTSELEHQRQCGRAGLFVLVSGLLLSQGNAAFAQPTLAHATAEQQALARQEYKRGLSAYDDGRHDEALRAFDASYEAVASPNSRLMAARCLLALERPAAAYRAFVDVTDMAEAWGNERYAESAAAARKEMEALKPRIVMLMLDIEDETDEATLTVDDIDVPRSHWHRPYATEAGNIAVVLSGPDGELDRRELSLDPGVAATVELRIDARPKPAQPQAPITPLPEKRAVTSKPASAPPEALAGDEGNELLRVTSFATGGLGLVGIAAFGVLGSMANASYGELERGCPDRMSCDPTLRGEAERGQRLQRAANISLIAGGVLLGCGATLFVLSLDEEETRLSLDARGISLRGRL